MTEQEWLLTATKPESMIQFLRGIASDRKLRLFGSSCYRSRWRHVTVSELYWDILRASESYADREITKKKFKYIKKRLPEHVGPAVWGAAWEVASRSAHRCSGTTLNAPTLSGSTWSDPQFPEQVAIQCLLLRDIFGNPFRPINVDPTWLTSTVISLAHGIYTDRAFERMPILADALQDAGCDNEDILSHCRQPGDHVRGCWVMDLLLDKK